MSGVDVWAEDGAADGVNFFVIVALLGNGLAKCWWMVCVTCVQIVRYLSTTAVMQGKG